MLEPKEESFEVKEENIFAPFMVTEEKDTCLNCSKFRVEQQDKVYICGMHRYAKDRFKNAGEVLSEDFSCSEWKKND